MMLPFEIAVGLVAVAVALVWSAMPSEPSPLRRASLVVMAIGALMIAIAGRFPPLPGQRGFSPFVNVGVVVVVASIEVSAAATVLRLFRKTRSNGRPSSGVE